jgi:hypothetical protein
MLSSPIWAGEMSKTADLVAQTVQEPLTYYAFTGRR